MTDAEKVLFKKIAHEFVDHDLALLIAAEEARIPAQYAGLVKMMADALLPSIVKALDAKIDAV